MAAVNIDYTSRDYEGLRASMLAYASQRFPQWTSRSPGDFGVLMVELMAYVGDSLSYYVDRAQAEAYLSTATLDSSVITLANTLGYTPQTGVPATGSVRLSLADAVTTVVPAGTSLAALGPDGLALFYETTVTTTLSTANRTPLVAVREGATVALRPLGYADGTPGQSFTLDDVPLVATTIEVFIDAPTGPAPWARVDYLADAAPGQSAYKISAAQDGAVAITFGDGVNGAVPAAGLGVYATYVRGGGTRGNADAGTDMTLIFSGDNVAVARLAGNPALADTSAMAGGVGADSRDDIRRKVPIALRTRNRAVTLSDYTDLALAQPGVVKASAEAQSATTISVYLLTSAAREVDAAPVRAAVATYLGARVPAGVTVATYPLVRKTLTIATPAAPLAITAYDTYTNVSVVLAVTKALRERYATERVVLGENITASEMYRTVLAVAGVAAVAAPTWSLSGSTSSTSSTLRVYEIPVLGEVNIAVSGGVG